MKPRIFCQLLPLGLLILLGLAACGGDDDSPSLKIASYRVELRNLTANQPLSPVALILHGSGYSIWQLGQAAGDGLEQLAEAGDPTALLQEARGNPAVRSTQGGTGAISPGTAASFTLDGSSVGARLSIASMLVNTNDAFAGAKDLDLSTLETGASQSWDLAPYDAGTEGNLETAATVPGPAGGGEGFNPLRDDGDYVRVHSGVISADDGLAGSALNAGHRFQSPVAQLVVTRLK